MSDSSAPFRPWAIATLVVNVIVILLGALVRASGSGAGCGRSWPTCQGEIIPSELAGATLIEFTHRAASGVALVMVIGLAIALRRAHAEGPIRSAALFSVVAIISEALIGAGIVLFEWVADDSSVARTIAVPLHLVNTLVLLAALTAVVLLLDGRRLTWTNGALNRLLRRGVGALFLVAATGAVAALADTLFPAASLAEGLGEDLSSTASVLTRLRIVHPIVATATGVLLVWLVTRPPEIRHLRDTTPARAVVWLVVAQIAAGLLNVALLVPIWMQLVHLALADALWIAFVWFGLTAVTAQRSSVSAS